MLFPVMVLMVTVLLTGSLFAREKPRVAIVFATGGMGDKSFNDSAMKGIKQAKARYGIEYDYAEPKAIAEYYTRSYFEDMDIADCCTKYVFNRYDHDFFSSSGFT